MTKNIQPDLTAKEACRILRVSYQTLRRMMEERQIFWYRTSNTKYGRPRIPAGEFEKLRISNYT